MAEQHDNHHHHHHHHHHHRDDASRFKEKSLRAIKLNRLAEKWGFRALCLVALLMILAVIGVYMFG